MKERKRFKTIEQGENLELDSVYLKIGQKNTIPFTGSKIIYASTASERKVVIKVPTHNHEAQHEWKGLRKAYLAGASVPSPIALIHFSKENLAIVSGFIEGESLSLNPRPEIKTKIGQQIRLIHQQAQINGNLWKTTGRKSFLYYDKHLFNWNKKGLSELKKDSKTFSVLNKHMDDMIKFCKNTDPVFNHNDLHGGQVIINKSDKPTIIDFGNWREEGWVNELAYHLFHLIRTDRELPIEFKSFLKGYLKNKELSENEKSVLAFYLLFISSRALNYFNNRQSSYLPIAKKNHYKVLSYLENESIWKEY